jgi:hypothetical protein
MSKEAIDELIAELTRFVDERAEAKVIEVFGSGSLLQV